MTDDEHGEGQDPLLVRPFIFRDSGSAGAGAGGGDDDASTQTWPSATTRETRSRRAMEGADEPTAVLLLDPAETRRSPRHRRRLLVMLVAGGLALLGLGAAGYAVVGPWLRPSAPAALPAEPLPPVTGPQTPTVASAATTASSSPGRQAGQPAATTAPATAGSASAAATATSAAAAPATTASASAGNEPTGRGPTAEFAPEPIAARTGTVRGQNGLCLDLNGAVPFDGNYIQVHECNGSLAQLWTWASDGTLRVLGKCALVVGDNTVQIVTCDGRTPAQWRVSGQLLTNLATGGCLTDPSGGRTQGTRATVTTCSGSANQRWSLP